MSTVPAIRIRKLNQCGLDSDGRFVLYWMISARRPGWNFALQHAVDLAEQLQKPLLILEGLRTDYPWASERLHRFVLQGMTDNRIAFAGSPARYLPYVERESGAGAGLLETLAGRSCCVVTDDFPCFFIPRMLDQVSKRLRVSLDAVDSNGLLPLQASGREFTTAYSFRRFLQKTLPDHLIDLPKPDPLSGARIPPMRRLPDGIRERWPEATPPILEARSAELSQLPIDHSVGPGLFDGGVRAAGIALTRFLKNRLSHYHEERNHPDADAASGLSPWLHFGHVSAAEIFTQIAEYDRWNPAKLQTKPTGSRSGWWGMSEPAESFLDELITWRELGYGFCRHRPDYDQFESLPDWALQTLTDHEADARPYVYSLEQFEAAETHDPLWNAAQRQLLTDGQMQNYLRMLWGKKILHWSESPREALRIMIELNNRYALDGRDPNSYSGIFWVLGRFDRAWGPERPVFGKVRYMTSESTARKLKLNRFLQQYSVPPDQQTLF